MISEKKNIRVFATGIAVICQLIALVSWWGSGWLYPYISPFGLLFGAIGLAFPSAIKPIFKRWMIMAAAIGRFQTKLILTVLFYIVITPLGLFFRLLSKNVMDIGNDPDASTYWKKRVPLQDAAGFEKQF